MFADNSHWIWLDRQTENENLYVEFRRVVRLAVRPRKARLLIAADSDYQVLVNGIELDGRQYSDYPHHRSYDAYAIETSLRRGLNCVAVRAYYRGRGASEYRRGRPGLIVQIDAGGARIVSDRQWLARRSPVYRSGAGVDQVTRQMGFAVQADCRRADAWTRATYRVARGWRAAAELAGPTDGYWRSLRPRVLPQMVRRPFQSGQVVCTGTLIRPPIAEHDGSPALAVASEYKRVQRPPPSLTAPWTFQPPRSPANGAYLLADLGTESFGCLRVDIEAPAGTRVDVAHGEHLEDLGVRAAPGYRRFVDRFICRVGRQTLTVPFRRLGARYIELHLTRFRRAVRVHAVGLDPLEYPVAERGAFDCADHSLTRLHAVAIRTLKRCMGDHYFDCPWREQSLYSYDSRNQALYGYYAFGEYDYPRQSFRLLGWGQRPDGLLDMCAPSNTPTTIPVFSLAWIAAVYEHWLFSGQSALFDEFRPVIERILQRFIAEADPGSGVFQSLRDAWIFYEWTTGMDHRPRKGAGSGFRLDAPHNLYLIEAMRVYAMMLALKREMAAAATWRQRADRLARAVHRVFWDARRGRYATYADRTGRQPHTAAGVQALALCAGIPPRSRRRALQQALVQDHSMLAMTLQVMGYGMQAMQQARMIDQVAMLDRIRSLYGGMVENGATTLWEVAHTSMMAPGLANRSAEPGGATPYAGDDAFAEAGSLCHGWSAVPIWVHQAYILGIRPLSPGFATFTVEPHACGLPHARGRIPTPHGPIDIAWTIHEGRMTIDLRHPAATIPIQPDTPGLRSRPRLRVRD